MPDRQISSEGSLLLRQHVNTAVTMKSPMWVMPVKKFVLLKRLEPHQVVRERGDLIVWNSDMKHVYFLSHQWTSFAHPDHTNDQLRCIQRLLMRMLTGDIPNTAADFACQAYLGKGCEITRAEWKRMIEEGAYIWLDYISVPQIGLDYLDAEASDLMAAVESIPAYVERVSHFFAVCPTISHADLPGVICDYGSWLQRGWCRLEMFSLLLSRFSRTPVIVVRGPEVAPYMIAPNAVLSRPPGAGELTCCDRKHRMPNPDGSIRCIPCDRHSIGPVVWTLLKSKIDFLRSQSRCAGPRADDHRIFMAAVPHFMRNLPLPDEAAAYSPITVEGFLRVFDLTSPNAEEGSAGSGITPLFLAATSGNLDVARSLIRDHCADVKSRTQERMHVIGLDSGVSPLHSAMCFGNKTHEAMLELLLGAGADLNTQSNTGFTALMAAVGYQSMPGVKALLAVSATASLDIEAGLFFNNAGPLNIASYLASTPVVDALIHAGADRSSLNDHGATVLHDACQNPEADVRMLELIVGTDGMVDVNQRYRPRSTKWFAIDVLFATMVRCGLSRTQFSMALAHTRGSTPLHMAAMNGFSRTVEWLLAHGASKSLTMKNQMGATPIDLAHIFGPHPEVQSMLAAAMLEHTFTGRASRRISLFRVRTGAVDQVEVKAAATATATATAIVTETEDAVEAAGETVVSTGEASATVASEAGDGAAAAATASARDQLAQGMMVVSAEGDEENMPTYTHATLPSSSLPGPNGSSKLLAEGTGGTGELMARLDALQQEQAASRIAHASAIGALEGKLDALMERMAAAE